MDPRQAMGQLTDAATLSTPWSQAEIDAGIAARYPDLKNSLALNQQLQGAVNQEINRSADEVGGAAQLEQACAAARRWRRGMEKAGALTALGRMISKRRSCTHLLQPPAPTRPWSRTSAAAPDSSKRPSGSSG